MFSTDTATMPLHLIKLAVGVTDPDHLTEVQNRRAASLDGVTRIPLQTRHTPKRGDEVLAGGSLYWVIKGSIMVRQPILAIDTGTNTEGGSFCTLQLAADWVLTVPTPHRPFQGWRYLPSEKAPADLASAGGDGAELPPHLAAELRELGLL